MSLCVQKANYKDINTEAIVLQSGWYLRNIHEDKSFRNLCHFFHMLVGLKSDIKRIKSWLKRNFNVELLDMVSLFDIIEPFKKYDLKKDKDIMLYVVRLSTNKIIFFIDEMCWVNKNIIEMHIFRQYILAILRLADKHNVESIATTLLGTLKVGLSVEDSSFIMYETINEYFRTTNSKLAVTLIISEKGLASDVLIGDNNVTSLYLEYMKRELDVNLEDVYYDIESCIDEFNSEGLRLKKSYFTNAKAFNILRHKGVLPFDIDELYQSFIENRKKYLLQHIRETEATYGRKLMLWIQKCYGFSVVQRLVEVTGLNKNTFLKFNSGKTERYDKANLLRIALGMQLQMKSFCEYVWASGETFPFDERDIVVLGYVENGKPKEQLLEEYLVEIDISVRDATGNTKWILKENAEAYADILAEREAKKKNRGIVY